jgi:hypothetical protein
LRYFAATLPRAPRLPGSPRRRRRRTLSLHGTAPGAPFDPRPRGAISGLIAGSNNNSEVSHSDHLLLILRLAQRVRTIAVLRIGRMLTRRG